MGFFTPAETLADPITASVTSGESGAVDMGSVSAWKIARAPASAGTLRFVCRTATQGAAANAAGGHVLTEADPSFGPVPFDAVRHITIDAVGGDVTYVISPARRV